MFKNKGYDRLTRIVNTLGLGGDGFLRIKTFYGWSEKDLDRKVNEFLSENTIEVVDIKFSTPIFVYSALVMYKSDFIKKKEEQ